jgi:hypothetical protein
VVAQCKHNAVRIRKDSTSSGQEPQQVKVTILDLTLTVCDDPVAAAAAKATVAALRRALSSPCHLWCCTNTNSSNQRFKRQP